MEHREALKPGGFHFLWDDALFPPVTDTFLLSAFPRLKSGLRVCDLGAGSGLLGLLLIQRQSDLRVTGLEVCPEAVRLAQRCAAENGLDNLRTVHMDLRDAPERFPPGEFDLVVSNPPYYSPGHGRPPVSEQRRSARMEDSCSPDELARTAAHLLRWGGAFCLVHKPERLADLLCVLRERGLEAKRLRFVSPTADAAPSLFLLEGRRGGKPGLSIEPPLILRRPDGGPSPELDAIYFRQEARI